MELVTVPGLRLEPRLASQHQGRELPITFVEKGFVLSKIHSGRTFTNLDIKMLAIVGENEAMGIQSC